MVQTIAKNAIPCLKHRKLCKFIAQGIKLRIP